MILLAYVLRVYYLYIMLNKQILETMINAILLGHHYTIEQMSNGRYMVQKNKPYIIAVKNTLESTIEAAHMDALTHQVASSIEAEKKAASKCIIY